MQAPLTHWLRLLWGAVPPVAFDGDCAFIAAGTIHLPPRPHWQQHTAAAAHASAHLVYSPRRFDGAGLGPIARTLLALLEDARVEALAIRELPGLARLWRPLHTAGTDSGVGFEGLAVRLARSLCDPAYDDPHPWVRKGRALCFLDAGLSISALRTPAELRTIATRLGHDIGQMRLPFNAKAPLPLPGYRDDHRWMWDADAVAEAPPPVAGTSGAEPELEPPDTPVAGEPCISHHPEWDRLIARLRPAWCRVVETEAADAAPVTIADATRAAAQRLLAPVRDLALPRPRRGCSDSGDTFDIDALVHWQLGQRLRRQAEARVYRSRQRMARRPALWLLIDRSASTAARSGQTAGGALGLAAQAALALGLALQARGIAFGVAAFASNGRQAVHWLTVKSFAQPADEAMAARVAALQPEGSTRLGAVLRHASQRLAARPARPAWVLLLSDGSPHDIDVHDPAYLISDARHAVSAAARKGVRMACLVFEPDGSGAAEKVFGAGGAIRVGELAGLPRALRRLLDRTAGQP